MTAEKRTCQNCNGSFSVETDDVAFYDKLGTPPPTFCPSCRMKRRFAWRNERHLYRRKDDMDGKEIFSGLPPQVPLTVYSRDNWWSDKWDPLSYGRDYDFSRPFFEQFKELLYTVPWSARSILNIVNSEYIDQAGNCKNLYLCFNIDYSEDSSYVVRSTYIKTSLDLLQCLSDELCYEGVMVNKSYGTCYSVNCEECTNVWFSKNCVGCSDCIGCVNLKNKSYHIFNQPYSKEEYLVKKEAMGLDSASGVEKVRVDALAFWKTFPVKSIYGIRNTGSSGQYIFSTKLASECYYVEDGENLKYLQLISSGAKDCYDYTVWGIQVSQMYECLTCGEQCDRLRFCFDCWPSCRELEYCTSCRSSSNCFGCVGLKKKEYCILNKQYSKEEYEALRAKIIEQMKAMPYTSTRGHSYGYGEFFPPELSPFAYNESMAADFFPLTQEQAEAAGYFWREPEHKTYEVTVASKDLPDRIGDVQDDVLQQIISCESCDRTYRIIGTELAFYRKLKLPLPRHCMECRFRNRSSFLDPVLPRDGSCDCRGATSKEGDYQNGVPHFHGVGPCPNTFRTNVVAETITYCEQCYQAEVA